MMYRLHSRIDESQNIEFECFEDMQEYAEANDISDSDYAQEEWIDNRINPELSEWKEIE
jgi:hypothetical protein